MPTALDAFSPLAREWFTGAFERPTPAQEGAWSAVSAGRNVLVVAPTGSGKTLAAFLWALDRIASRPATTDGPGQCRVVYVSPLKALAVDVERNLRSPLAGMRRVAAQRGEAPPEIDVAVRSGDTTAQQRRRIGRQPPDVLITTPESLFLMLTSQARESLRGVETVIVDEVHAVAGSKRGAHLALSLERLDALLERPAQRVGLSATVRPVEEVARFLGGPHAVEVVQPEFDKTFDLRVVVPVEDMTALGETPEPGGADGASPPQASIWPHVEERIADLVLAQRSTIVFANSRRLSERLTGRLNDIAAERAGGADGPAEIARAHHGSVSKERRAAIEDDLKSGRLPAVVATSSLELGIDMGAVDLVVQVESPPSVASGLQRVGRAGHQVGAVSRGVVFPKHRGDLVQTAVVVERMNAGLIEELQVPRHPLDVLAQHVVSAVSMDPWVAADLAALVRRAYPFRSLPDSAFTGVLDMLSGRYPSDEFAELRPRVVWDRTTDVLTGRPGAQRLAVTSGGTIPDRGLFGVFLAGEGASRVGELDEEMVYESRVGDVFTLGASSWRIEDITHDRVLVSPAPGQPGKVPFWHGDAAGRPAELGRAMGAFVREVSRLPADAARSRVRTAGLDDWAADNLLAYLAEQRAATGHVPDDRTIVVERFRDELGDWRMVVHTPFGARLHAPWALAVGARLRERYGVEAQAAHSDDGMVFRVPDTWSDDEPSGPAADLVVLEPEEVEALVTAEVGGSAMFAARFREAAARALLLPRRNPGRRTPLWQQRQRSAHLLEVASRYGSFPIVLETMREVLQDVYDLPGLTDLMRGVAGRAVRIVEVETPVPSPFARTLLFGYVASFLYEGDAPLAERRAHALTLDATLLAELLGQAELRDLLDEGAMDDVEHELQRLAPDRKARDAEGVADLLRTLGPLSTAEVQERAGEPASAPRWLADLEEHRRAIRVKVAGAEHWAAIEDAGRLRDALGAPLPVGIPDAFTEPVADPLGDLVSRYARTHGPFAAHEVAARLGIGIAIVVERLRRLAGAGRVVEGEFRPGRSGTEWCDANVLRQIRRRSLAALRHEVEPVEPVTLARFLPAWQSVGSTMRGPEGVLRVVEQLAGYPVPASALESLVLPARLAGYSPAWLDELTTGGDVVWSGHGQLPGNDGWVSLHPGDGAPLTLADPAEHPAPTPSHQAVLDLLTPGGGYFFRQICDHVTATAGPVSDAQVVTALWDLVWAGLLSNDTLAPLRATLGGRRRPAASPRARYGTRRGATVPARGGPPNAAGRWSLLPRPVDPRPGARTVSATGAEVAPDTRPARDPNAATAPRAADPAAGHATRRGHALAEILLDRYGVVTRGAVAAERVPGGFAAVYRVLSALEEAGRARRGYFVAGLGAAQFATPGAVDRLRATPDAPALVLAATDPANPYGAALPWPARPADGPAGEAATRRQGHRPGRKAGALVVLADGLLTLYVERGGRTLLSWHGDDAELTKRTADALVLAIREGALGRLSVERADGESVLRTPLGEALALAGFHATPRGLRLRR